MKNILFLLLIIFSLSVQGQTKKTILIDSTNIKLIQAGSGALVTYDNGDITIENYPKKKKKDYLAIRLVELYDEYQIFCKKNKLNAEFNQDFISWLRKK